MPTLVNPIPSSRHKEFVESFERQIRLLQVIRRKLLLKPATTRVFFQKPSGSNRHV